MAQNQLWHMDETEHQPVKEFAEQAYLDYSMYVILDRALPHIGDGLKPVQRRIIYAMSELGLKASAKYKKSARTVGDVLGKFHPHGDTACYEAMVLMAQPFSYRYPLIDGQGNWGAPDDPKSFAAMRYTESRLARYAEVLLTELGLGTVDWVPNFDGTLEEPAVLPARLPNCLLNGGTGIAVGMATDIPPHNLKEVASACIRLLEEPNTSIEGLCEHIQGPDYPTGAEIITPRADIINLYKTGNGSIRMRAVYAKTKDEIVITALPYQTSGAKVLEQIAAQMQARKLPMVTDLRDESDHQNPTRIVITPRSNRVNVEELMTHLFASTDLERNYRVNLNVIGIDGRPQVKNLKLLLQEWLSFRTETVTRRLQFRLDKILARLHILAGLMIAFLNIDEVIAIIRTEDQPKPVLMQRFNLSDKQSEAILELKLRQLAKLEEMKIRAEQEDLEKERNQIEKTLGSKARMKKLMREEILQDAEKYGDDRRCAIVERAEAQALKAEAMLPSEPVTVVLSQKGWARSAKGHDVDGGALSYKAGDAFKMQTNGRSNLPAVFFDSGGRAYSLLPHLLPSARGQGEPLTGRLNPPPGHTFAAVITANNEDLFLLGSDAGYGFVVKYADLISKGRAGKAVVNLPNGSQLLTPRRIENVEDQFVALVTNIGRMLIFPVALLPALPRGKGNKMINIPAALAKRREEYVVDVAILNENSRLTIHAGKRKYTMKPADLAHFHGERGRRGHKLPRGVQRVDWVEVG